MIDPRVAYTRSYKPDMNIQIDHSQSVNRDAWDAYVLAHPDADHYHLSGWGRVIETVYGYEALYVSAWNGPAIVGVLPIIVMGGAFTRNSLVSMPFLDYGGICADNPETAQVLYEATQKEMIRARGSLVDLRHRKEVSLPLTTYSDKVTMVLEVSKDSSDMWKKCGSKLRNQIRKAEKEQLQTRWTNIEGLKDFYDVYSFNMRDLGSPPHSFGFFRQILVEFSDTQILLIQHGSKVIGGGLCLTFRDTMLVPWASSLRPYFHLCPNNLFYWEAIRTACDKGLVHFDFGRSSRGSGTYQFKKQWGAAEEALYWQSNVPGGCLVDQAGNHALELVVKIWKTLPVNITRFIGPILRRRLSN
jgi:FemAB-related protein (PEP-CTERM system-associated)